MFEVHRLNIEGMDKAHEIARAFKTLLHDLENIVGAPASREMSIVKTKLQEASFFAKRAMAQKPENQED